MGEYSSNYSEDDNNYDDQKKEKNEKMNDGPLENLTFSWKLDIFKPDEEDEAEPTAMKLIVTHKAAELGSEPTVHVNISRIELYSNRGYSRDNYNSDNNNRSNSSNSSNRSNRNRNSSSNSNSNSNGNGTSHN